MQKRGQRGKRDGVGTLGIHRATHLVSGSRVEILEFFDCGVGGGLGGEVTAGC